MPNGVDVDAFRPTGPPPSQPVVVFTGMMDYEPNVEAVHWFAAEVWPRVVAARPGARFLIVGAQADTRCAALADRDSSIEVTGRVDAVQPYLWRAAVAVAPLFTARGLQNKVLESLGGRAAGRRHARGAQGLPAGVDEGMRRGRRPGGLGPVRGRPARPHRGQTRDGLRSQVERLSWPRNWQACETFSRQRVQTESPQIPSPS